MLRVTPILYKEFMKYFVGIDFGTSGVRAIAINIYGEILAISRTEYDIRDYKTWQSALYEVIASLPKKIRQATNKIVIDGTSATVLICDRDGKAIGAPMIYSDACSQEVLEHVKKIAPPQHSVASATSSFAKLVLFLENEGRSPSFSNLYLLHQADWLGYLLHGRLGMSDYNNALKLGYDPNLLDYPDWLKDWTLQNPKVILPEVFAPSKTIGIIQEAIALKLNLPIGCEIGAGTTDSNAAFLASVGTAKPAIGTAVTSLGSTMVLKVLSDRPINDSRYGIYSHRFEHPDFGCLWLVGGASNVGGAVLRQFFTDQQLQELSDRIDPNISSSLDYYPLPKKGDRFPINDPNLLPRLKPRPDDPVEFLHGLLESMARIEAEGYKLLQVLGASPIQQIYTAGGGAKNQTWTKIRDHYLQIPMQQAIQTEAAFGAALLAKSI
jgi:xylulokinase